MLFDGDGNRMTPSHAVKKGTRYRYYVSHSLITKDRTDASAGLRLAGEPAVIIARAHENGMGAPAPLPHQRRACLQYDTGIERTSAFLKLSR